MEDVSIWGHFSKLQLEHPYRNLQKPTGSNDWSSHLEIKFVFLKWPLICPDLVWGSNEWSPFSNPQLQPWHPFSKTPRRSAKIDAVKLRAQKLSVNRRCLPSTRWINVWFPHKMSHWQLGSYIVSLWLNINKPLAAQQEGGFDVGPGNWQEGFKEL